MEIMTQRGFRSEIDSLSYVTIIITGINLIKLCASLSLRHSPETAPTDPLTRPERFISNTEFLYLHYSFIKKEIMSTANKRKFVS